MKKTQKIFTKLAITFGVAFVACMATIPTQMSKYYEEKQEAEYLKAKKYASYDDEDYVITLTPNELNNYTYQNLANFIITNGQGFAVVMPDFTYNNDNLLIDESTITPDIYAYYVGDLYALYFNKLDGGDTTNDYKFYLYEISTWNLIQAEENIDINLVVTYYADIKQAIELDIQANQPHTIAGDIIASITAGLGMIGVLAGEFLTGFSTLFWTGSELTTFALFSLVFLGISITFAIISLVLNVLRNNTGV